MTEPSVEILLVQQDHAQIQMTLEVVQSNRLANRIHVVRDGAEALEFLFRCGAYAGRHAADPRLVLYALRLTETQDIEALKRITADPRSATIPVTVLARSRDDRLAAISELREHDLHLPVVVIARPAPTETVRALASLAGRCADAGEDDESVAVVRGADCTAPRPALRRVAAPVPAAPARVEHDLDAMVKLTRDAAHQFNNLFSVFIAYTELLLKDLDLDDPRRAGADEIFKSIGQACRLTRQMLTFRPAVPEPPKTARTAGSGFSRISSEG